MSKKSKSMSTLSADSKPAAPPADTTEAQVTAVRAAFDKKKHLFTPDMALNKKLLAEWTREELDALSSDTDKVSALGLAKPYKSASQSEALKRAENRVFLAVQWLDKTEVDKLNQLKEKHVKAKTSAVAGNGKSKAVTKKSGKRHTYTGDEALSLLAKENPYREGTDKAKFYGIAAKVKTVSAFYKSVQAAKFTEADARRALNRMVEFGKVKVTAK